MIRTFSLTGPINLSVRLGHGSLEIKTVEDLTEARVELEGSDESLARVEVELAGPTLTVHAARPGGLPDLLALGRHKNESVRATVTVPTGTAMKLATFTAPIAVRGRCGGADVTTAAGAIDLDEVDGDLSLRFGATSSTTGRVTGSVTVRSGAGHAEFREVLGDLHAGCARGRLSVGTVRGAVRWRSGAGEAHFAAVFGDVDLASGSGAMSIGLPAGVTAHLDVTTGAGRVRTELPVTEQPVTREGAITIRARTGNGDVRLFRAA